MVYNLIIILQEQQTAQVPAVDEGFTEWDNWDKPSPAPQHLPQPTQQWPTAQPISSRPAAPEPAEPEPEPDYFSDLGLAPTIKKQKKVNTVAFILIILINITVLHFIGFS